MAWAICEKLLEKKAFTFFTTHFLYLTRLEDLYFNVVNLHTLANEDIIPGTDNVKRLTYLHQIVPGVTDIDDYGITLAKNTNMPVATTQHAEELVKIIALRQKPLPTASNEKETRKKLYKLNAELKQASRDVNVTAEILNTILKKFKSEIPEIISENTIKRNEMVSSTNGYSRISQKELVMSRVSDLCNDMERKSNCPRTSSSFQLAHLCETSNHNTSSNTSNIPIFKSSDLHNVAAEFIDIPEISQDFDDDFDISDLCTQKLNISNNIESSDSNSYVSDISCVSMQNFIKELNDELELVVPPPPEFADDNN